MAKRNRTRCIGAFVPSLRHGRSPRMKSLAAERWYLESEAKPGLDCLFNQIQLIGGQGTNSPDQFHLRYSENLLRIEHAGNV